MQAVLNAHAGQNSRSPFGTVSIPFHPSSFLLAPIVELDLGTCSASLTRTRLI